MTLRQSNIVDYRAAYFAAKKDSWNRRAEYPVPRPYKTLNEDSYLSDFNEKLEICFCWPAQHDL